MKTYGLTVALFAVAAALAAPGAAAGPTTFVNGPVSMGVNDDGSLGGGAGTGLALAGVGDAITPGCLCEGWGAAANGVGGYTYGGGPGTFGAASLIGGVSTVTTGLGLDVTHTYSNVPGGQLFRIDISITNTSGALATDVRYARTLDWDVPPGHFSDDSTTIFVPGGAPAGRVLHTSFNPFAVPNPMLLRGTFGGVPANTNAVDATGDLGAYFVLSFGDLGVGASADFTTYIGAAATTADLLAAFGAVSVEAYSYSFDNDGPVTFGWGFAGVGLPPITPVPVPGALALLGLGLAALAAMRRRRLA